MTDLKKVLNEIIYKRKTPTQSMIITSEIKTILDDLFKDGSYIFEVIPDKYTRNGIYLEVEAHMGWLVSRPYQEIQRCLGNCNSQMAIQNTLPHRLDP